MTPKIPHYEGGGIEGRREGRLRRSAVVSKVKRKVD